MLKDILVEVCCGSAEDVLEAFRAGADRVELNSDLFHGGLTPTIGSLLVAKRETGMKIMTMVRPREGGFCYTETEFAVALEDARQLLRHGSDGLVFGFLHKDGTVDAERTKQMADLALSAGKEAVFHRAIDVVPDWKEALDLLISLHITRVLTSGQEPDVFYGAETVKEMIRYADGRIQILPGAGITSRNVHRIIQETGTSQIHVAAHRTMEDPSVHNNRAIFYGGCLYPQEDRFLLTDRNAISGIVSGLSDNHH